MIPVYTHTCLVLLLFFGAVLPGDDTALALDMGGRAALPYNLVASLSVYYTRFGLSYQGDATRTAESGTDTYLGARLGLGYTF